MKEDLKDKLKINIVVILIIYIFFVLIGILANSDPCSVNLSCIPTSVDYIKLFLFSFLGYGIIFIPILILRIKFILKNSPKDSD
jgi:hypothetical protein